MLTHTHFARLLPLYVRERDADRNMVLATIVRTAGSTYRKAGAQMLITQQGEYAGLLSGGCLEGDLREHARQVLASGQARIIQYDMRSADDQLFGLGAGCEGAMDILLQCVSHQTHWQPLAAQHASWQKNVIARLALIVASKKAEQPVGSVLLDSGKLIVDHRTMQHTWPSELANAAANSVQCLDQVQWFVLHSPPPPRVLILGAGPDAQPLAQLIHFLGWKATLYDHRAAYTAAERFVHAEQIITARPEQLHERVRLDDYHAIVVMSHHLDSDMYYLRAVTHCQVSYIGLLGPAARREKLFSDLGADYRKLRERLHAPVGLPIGAATPEAIALAIVSEIHQVLAR